MRAIRLLPLVCGTALSFVLPAHAGALLYVASGGANQVITIDTASNTQVGAPIAVGVGPQAPVASPDGTRVYVQSSADGHVYLIDTRTRSVASVVLDPAATGLPQGLALSPDGSRLYLIESGSIALLDTGNGAVVGRIPFSGDAARDTLHAVPSNDGRTLYVAFGSEQDLVAIDTATLTASAPIALGGKGTLRGLDIARDDRTLYLSDDGGDFFRVDTASHAVTRSALPSTLGSVAVAPDGKHVYASATGGACLVTLDLADNTFASAGIGANQCRNLALAPDGSAIYLGSPGTTPDASSVLAIDARDPLQNTYAAMGVSSPQFSSASIAPATIFPQPGLWANPAESGRGYTIEVQGTHLVLVANVFDAQGDAQWFFSAGAYDAASGTYSGTLDGYTNGQCLGCAYQLPTYTRAAAGGVRAVFASPTQGTLFINGSSTPIEKLSW
jgi:YVTN family beta-propeller protein